MNETRYREAERRLWESVGVAAAERRLRLERNDVTVRIQEVGEGSPVVFLHGGSTCGSSWATLVARLEGFGCVLVDRPGCGLSDPLPKELDAGGRREIAETLVVDVLDALGLESAYLVATSFGGYFALRAAAAYPGRIRRLMLFGWPVGAAVARLPALMRLASVPVVGRMLAAVPPNERAVRAMFRQIGLRQALDAGRISQEVIDCYLSLLRDTDTMRNELAWRFISPLRGLDDRLILSDDVLAAIQPPVYFLWGEQDLYGGADIAREFVDRMPNAELELMPGAGHAVWMDDPDHVAKVMTRFFRD